MTSTNKLLLETNANIFEWRISSRSNTNKLQWCQKCAGLRFRLYLQSKLDVLLIESAQSKDTQNRRVRKWHLMYCKLEPFPQGSGWIVDAKVSSICPCFYQRYICVIILRESDLKIIFLPNESLFNFLIQCLQMIFNIITINGALIW